MWSWAEWVADTVVGWTGWTAKAGAGAALHFFIFDVLKISVLILGIAFVMSLVRQALPLARLRAWLEAGRARVLGYPAAAAFGALTPFCSCSSVPLFLGFVQARFPIGVAFAFLITSPLVNEIAFVLMGVAFGWKIAAAYAVAGLTLGVVGGLALTALRAERWLAVGAIPEAELEEDAAPAGWRAGAREAADTSFHIFRKVAPWLLAALALGAALHGFVPSGYFERWFAGTGMWTVPLAAFSGFPLYVSANATVPLLEAFVAKGVPLGTALAFILAAVGVSLPELTMLRSVMTVRLLGLFTAIVLGGTVLIGWMFNVLW
jgi:uncharacterized protein